MRRVLSFSEMLRTYRLKGRTLLALLQKGDDITLRFDLYHCDDPDRCEDGIEYLLDVTVSREQFRILDGAGECLHEKFSADLLAAEISGNELRLVADCTFYVSRDRDVVTIALTGGEAALKEYPPESGLKPAILPVTRSWNFGENGEHRSNRRTTRKQVF